MLISEKSQVRKKHNALINRISRKFEAEFGQSRLSNKKNPLDELIFIILTIKTHEKNYQKTYLNFRRKFKPWSKILNTSVFEISKSIESGGLGMQKAVRLKESLEQINTLNGSMTLNHLKKLNTENAEKYLINLPGVGKKIARCVLLYSLDRQVFPVDVNTMRIFKRLNLINQDLDYKRDWVHDYLQDMVIPEHRYQLHVGLVLHGRKYCLPRNPKCELCIINSYCDYWKERRTEPE